MIRFVRRKRNAAPTPRNAIKRRPSAALATTAPEAIANEAFVHEDDLNHEDNPTGKSEATEARVFVHKDAPAPSDGFAHEEERFFSESETDHPEPAEHLSEEPPFGSIAPVELDADEPIPLLTRVEDKPAACDVSFEIRRKRLRKAVMLTLCGSAALLLLGVARRTPPTVHAKSTSVPARIAAAAGPDRAQRTLAPTPVVPPPMPSASAAEAIDEHSARASAHALVASARALLQAGRIRAGVDVARQALAANGSDAEPYILLAAGLQDLGDWSGAQRVFSACKANARSGSHAECSYFSTQKH